MKHYYFLKSVNAEGRIRLRPIAGQVEGDTSAPISTSMNVQADSVIRGAYPIGTVFGTESLYYRDHAATPFYSAGTIYPLTALPQCPAHTPSREMAQAYDFFSTQMCINNMSIEICDDSKHTFRSDLRANPEMARPTIRDDGFFVTAKTWELLGRNLKRQINTILIGQTGTGKTELCLLACKRLDIPCRVYDMGSMHDPLSQMLGTHRLKGGESVFEYARFAEDVQKPGVILLDELSRAPLGTANILIPCLDSRRTLPVEMAGGEGLRSVPIHPECMFIATANVGAEYTGTFSMDRALTGRFFPLEFEYMPEAEEAEVLKKRYSISASDALNIVAVARTARNLFEKQEVSCSISTRETLAAASLVADGWSALEAMEAVFLPLYEGTRAEGERSIISKAFLTR